MNTSKIVRFNICLVILSAVIFNLSANSLSEGEKIFRENQPLQASVFFEKAVSESPKNPSAYNLLGLCYYQLGKYSEAIETFINGTTFSNNMQYTLYYNAGNAAFAMGDYIKAEEYYTSAYTLNNNCSPAVLNRANSKMKQTEYQKACDDYKLYLQMEPDAIQRNEIERLIDLLTQEINESEVEKIRAAKEEEFLKSELERLLNEKENQRIEQEMKMKRDAERRKRLLEEISASLEDTNSTNFSAGSEGVEEYEQNSKLD